MADADVKVKIGIEGDQEAQNKLKGLATSMTNMSSTFKKAGTVMLGVGTALGGGMLALTAKWAQAGDEVAKMSKRTGWAVESLSELRHVAEISGTSLDAIEKSTRRLSQAIIDASEGGTTYQDALARIGLTAEDLMGIPIEEQFWKVSYAMSELEDNTIKTATAMELFGRSGTELLPMLEEGKDGIQDLREEASELGIVFDEEAAKNAEEFQDAMTRLKNSMAGVGAELAKTLAPEITKFVDKATAAITVVKEWAAANPGLVNVLKVLVAVLVGGGGLLLALSQIARAIVMINSALAIFHALSGPAGWIKLAAGMAIAGGAIYGISKLMGGGTTTTRGLEVAPGVYQPPYPGMQHGGIVPGPIGKPIPIIAHGGEPFGGIGGKAFGDSYVFNVNVEGSVVADRELADAIYTRFLERKGRNATLELA